MDTDPPFLSADFEMPLDAPFTRAAALDEGVTDNRLKRLVASGHLRRPIRNVYVASQVPDSLRLRCQMAGLVVPSDAFVCDRTAAWIHRGDDMLAPNEHLSVPPLSCFRISGKRALRNDLTDSGERYVRDSDLMEIEGLTLTTPLRTAVDLGRLQRSRDMKLWGLDAMLGLEVFTDEELLAEVPRFRGRRGVVTLRVLAPLADGGSQSFGESAGRLRWYDAGIPRPRTQVPVDHPNGFYYVDIGLEELFFGAEYYGEVWHTDEHADDDDARLEWCTTRRSWQIEVLRKENVFGQRQDADLLLRQAYQTARKTFGSRTFFI